jgi:propanediol dehydratase small subunit
VYGPAAPLLWEYFVVRQHEVRKGKHLWIDQNVDAPYLTHGFLRNGRALLRRASLKADSQAGRRRIARQLLSLDYVEVKRERRCAVQGASYAPADPTRVKSDTERLVTAAAALGITHLREGYPMAQEARDWGDLSTARQAVLLHDGATEATVIEEPGGRVIMLGRPNILRVADPGEWTYPHAGGISVTLSDGYLTAPQPIAWENAASTPQAITLTGKSTAGRVLEMRIEVTGETLKIQTMVSNTGNQSVPLAVLCRAEFGFGVSREAVLRYRDGAGKPVTRRIRFEEGKGDGSALLSGIELTDQEWTLDCEDLARRITNRFRTGEVARCGVSWSFRGSTGLNINMTATSPEIDLAPGRHFILTSEYALSNLGRLA